MNPTAAFESLPLAANLALLLVSAISVWLGGARLANYCKTISEETGIGDALLGTVLLGVIASLPELTMSVTAALQAQAQLALSILLGGVTMAVLILAITDAAVGDEPLSSDVVSPVVLLQGALTILLLAVAAAGIVIQDVPLRSPFSMSYS
jgi:cation:H+ antiporter